MLPPKKRLLDQVRDRLRLKNYAYRFDISVSSGEKAETSTDGTIED